MHIYTTTTLLRWYLIVLPTMNSCMVKLTVGFWYHWGICGNGLWVIFHPENRVHLLIIKFLTHSLLFLESYMQGC